MIENALHLAEELGLPVEADCNIDELGEVLSHYLFKETSCGAWLAVREDEQGQYIRIGSIVEGVDACAGPIELRFPLYISEYDEAVEEIEAEAYYIWMSTHGCETCKAHWVDECEDVAHPEYGEGVRVWGLCPDCQGEGIIL